MLDPPKFHLNPPILKGGVQKTPLLKFWIQHCLAEEVSDQRPHFFHDGWGNKGAMYKGDSEKRGLTLPHEFSLCSDQGCGGCRATAIILLSHLAKDTSGGAGGLTQDCSLVGCFPYPSGFTMAFYNRKTDCLLMRFFLVICHYRVFVVCFALPPVGDKYL